MRQRFVQGVGGTLRFLPPQALQLGAPTSPTITVKSSRGLPLPTPVVAAAAAVDPVDTATTADAIEGDQDLVLADVAGVTPLRSYLVTTTKGVRFLVEVALVDVETKTVTTFEKLSADLEVGATFQGVELSYALAGAQCPDPLSQGYLYRAAWEFEFGGVKYSADQLYEVRRRLLLPVLTADEVERKLPAPWGDLSDQGPRAIAKAIEDAWDDLLDELASRGYEPDRIMDCARLRKPHRSLVLAQLGTTWGKDWREWANDRSEEHEQDLSDALNAGDWYEKIEDGIQAAGEVKWQSTVLER